MGEIRLLDGGGKPVWRKIWHISESQSGTPSPLADSASPQELLFSAVRRKSLPQKYAAFKQRWGQLQHAQSVLRARRVKQPDGVYEGKPEVLSEH